MAARANDRQAAEQGEVVAFLCNAANWPEPVEVVRHVETHISHLFLGRKLALKMKKALRLPYLDFSTLALREHFCRREWEINRRFSPWLYLGLSRVARLENGGLALDPPEEVGETVEWLVRMRRFDEEAILANRFRHSAPDARLLKDLAGMACAAHQRAEPRAEDHAAGMLLDTWWQVHDALAPRADALNAPEVPDAGRVLGVLRERLEAARAVLDARGREGYVRRCHGDMHLGNIVLWEGRPALFDAIEFSERLATIDIMYDLAFLLMDLLHRGHGAEEHGNPANVVMNAWLARCDDEENHAACSLFAPLMSLRALIRCMVLMDLAAQQEADDPARVKTVEEARAYVRTAHDCLRPARPVLLVVGGLSGSGKTTLASALAARLAPAAGMAHLRSDVERKVMAGVDEFTKLPPEAYTPEMSRKVYERLQRRAGKVLASSWPVVVDAVFARPEERAAMERVAKEAGVPFIGLWLDAPAEVLRQRVAGRTGDASDATVAVLEKQLSYDLGEITCRRVDASGTPEEVLEEALRVLAEVSVNPTA